MRSKKCLGFFLLLGLCVVSLSIFSDVKALSHHVAYMPLTSESSWSGGSTSWPVQNQFFRIAWTDENLPDTSKFDLNQDYYFRASYEEQQNKCVYGSPLSGRPKYSSVPYFESQTNEFVYGFDSYKYFYNQNSYPDYYSEAVCMQNPPFGQLPPHSNIPFHHNFDDSSLVNIPVLDRSPYLNLSPYYFDYDVAYFSDNAIDTSTGIHYSNSLKFSDLVGVIPKKFLYMRIPLGQLDESVSGEFYQGREVKLKGAFDFSGENVYFNWADDMSNSYFRLYYSGRTYEQSTTLTDTNTSGYADCTVIDRQLPAENWRQLEFECPLTLPVTFYDSQLYFWLGMGNSVSNDGANSYLFDTNADWSYSAMYIITDNDETPGGKWGYEPHGNHLDRAPGSAKRIMPNNDNIDWYSSIISMFGFSFINPFAPLFNMFTDQSQCAQIPTIASMVHSNETQVCPYFDSTTRNIVTPVLGISSLMLVFGFVVRWLGGSSGNYFDDSGTGSGPPDDSGGIPRYHYRFGRKVE